MSMTYAFGTDGGPARSTRNWQVETRPPSVATTSAWRSNRCLLEGEADGGVTMGVGAYAPSEQGDLWRRPNDESDLLYYKILTAKDVTPIKVAGSNT